MTITRIEERRKHLCAVFIDDEKPIFIDSDIVLESHIKVGDEIDDEFLHKLILDSDNRRAKEKALWLISSRDHSRRELFDKLMRSFNEDVCISVLDRLEELKLIDDERFATRYALDLYNVKLLPMQSVKYKLIEKGIDKELAETIAQELAPDADETLYKLINKKYYRAMFDEKGRIRARNALIRSGYRWSEIQSAFMRFNEENDIAEQAEDYYE